MALGHRTRAWIAAGALPLTAITCLLSAGSATAQGLGVSLPVVEVSLPPVGVSPPAASSSTHTSGISLPSVGVTLPSVGVTVPSVGASLPGVSVSTPEVVVTTPEVSVTTPQVTVSTPSTPAGGSTETPTGSTPTGGGSPGGGSGGSSGGSTSGGSSGGTGSGSSGEPPSATANGSLNATAASVSDSTGARTSSATTGSPAAHQRAAGVRTRAGTGKRSHTSVRRRPGGLRDHAGNAVTGPADASGATALGLAGSRATRAASAPSNASKPASNPLDSIGRHIPLPLPVPDWSKPIIVLLLLLAIAFAVRSRTAVRRARRLERQRVTLLRDVGAMQAALVPEVPARVGGLGISVAYRPAEGPGAGGDFYDVFVPERGKVAIILGDVAGHGHQALKQAALTRYTLRAYLQAGLQPRAALALAGRVLADPEVERFATVALALYDTRDGRLTYASAGHPPPLVHGPWMRAPLEVCASPPIGWTVPTGRRQTTVSLAPGAVVCFFSDGLIEARCKDDELLGHERLGELLAALGPRPDATKLLARVRATALATPDDMATCILAPEIAIVGTRTHVEELEVEARALATGKVRQFLEACELPAAEIEPTIECASEIVALWGSALLSIELEGEHATAAVSVPSTEPRVAMPDDWPQPAGDPSGAR
jgi:serine phosphatase RsbU (regulator of sigma subunit)